MSSSYGTEPLTAPPKDAAFSSLLCLFSVSLFLSVFACSFEQRLSRPLVFVPPFSRPRSPCVSPWVKLYPFGPRFLLFTVRNTSHRPKDGPSQLSLISSLPLVRQRVAVMVIRDPSSDERDVGLYVTL